MDIKFLDLKKINSRFQSEFDQSFKEFIESGYYILGQKTKQFEIEFAKYCQSKYCLGVANGLDALILIFKALIHQKKLKLGDTVALQGNTFIASALAAVHCGLRIKILTPTEGYNLSISDVKSQVGKDVKCLLLVHLYGEMKDTEAIASFCEEEKIILVEDAAQAHGAKWNGVSSGKYGIAAGFSFYPGKNLGALGDGGAIVTNDDSLFEELSYLRNYGSKIKYHHDRLGFNSRLDEIQAGFLSIKLSLLDQDNQRRRDIANMYYSEIKNSNLTVETPSLQPLAHVHHLFLVATLRRDHFKSYLQFKNIDTLIHYPHSVIDTDEILPYVVSGSAGYNAEKLNHQIISLPISPVMTNDEVNYIIESVNDYSI